jgi:hypothetical protein
MEGIDRTIVPMISRSSGNAEISRVTRMRRARRATIANAPACGSRDAATTPKSNTFQPLAKNRPGRGQYARMRTAISATKIVWIRTSSAAMPPR